jgi:hypothetical protein
MTLGELRQKYERMAHDFLPGTMVPAAEVYRLFAGELTQLTDIEATPMSVDTGEAARMIGVASKTVANWCAAGTFPGARKTGGRGGKWIVPVVDVQAYLAANDRTESR